MEVVQCEAAVTGLQGAWAPEHLTPAFKSCVSHWTTWPLPKETNLPWKVNSPHRHFLGLWSSSLPWAHRLPVRKVTQPGFGALSILMVCESWQGRSERAGHGGEQSR